MSFLRMWGRAVIYPYLYLGKTLKKTFQNVRESGRTVEKTFKQLQKEAADVNAMVDDGFKGRQAFRDRYEKAGWTEASIRKRREMVIRNKWACRIVAILFGIAGIACFFVFPGFWGAITAITLLLAMCLYLVRTFLACLYLAQIEEKNLMTAKQFFSRPNVFRRVLVG